MVAIAAGLRVRGPGLVRELSNCLRCAELAVRRSSARPEPILGWWKTGRSQTQNPQPRAQEITPVAMTNLIKAPGLQ